MRSQLSLKLSSKLWLLTRASWLLEARSLLEVQLEEQVPYMELALLE